MRFIGIDFGWEGKPSGLCALDWNGNSLHLLALERVAEEDSILEWVEAHAGEDSVAGIDAPIVIENAAGMREADKLAHSLLREISCGRISCQPRAPLLEADHGLERIALEVGIPARRRNGGAFAWAASD